MDTLLTIRLFLYSAVASELALQHHPGMEDLAFEVDPASEVSLALEMMTQQPVEMVALLLQTCSVRLRTNASECVEVQ